MLHLHKPVVNFRSPKYCGGPSVHGESARGCKQDELTGLPECKCLAKPKFNCPLVFALAGEVKTAKLHLSKNIMVDWALFCTAQSIEGGSFSRYATMDAKQLRKNFMVMCKEFEVRNGLGKGAGYEYTKEETPLDRLFISILRDCEAAGAVVKLLKEQKEEICSTKLYFERSILSAPKKPSKQDSDYEEEDDSEDESMEKPFYQVPSRNVSMLQRKEDELREDGDEESAGEISDDEEKGSSTKAYSSKDSSGFTTIRPSNKPQNGKLALFVFLFFDFLSFLTLMIDVNTIQES